MLTDWREVDDEAASHLLCGSLGACWAADDDEVADETGLPLEFKFTAARCSANEGTGTHLELVSGALSSTDSCDTA